MPSTESTTTYRLTDAEALGTFAMNLTSGIIIIVDDSDVPTGELRQVNASGVAPTKIRSFVEAVVADPGDGNDIDPPTDGADFSCAITTAGAETRVLTQPTKLLQTALITFAVDVGDFTMDNASGWDDSGSSGNLATFADAGDAFLVIALGIGAVTDWRVVAKKGVALS